MTNYKTLPQRKSRSLEQLTPDSNVDRIISGDEELEHFRAFAKHNRLKITRDECGDPVIQGTHGHLSPVGDKIMACLDNRETAHAKQKLLRFCRRDADDVLAGFDNHEQQWNWILSVQEPVCWVEGDTEAIFVFDPGDKEFLKLCLRFLGIKRKRQVSDATRQRLRQQGFRARKSGRRSHCREKDMARTATKAGDHDLTPVGGTRNRNVVPKSAPTADWDRHWRKRREGQW